MTTCRHADPDRGFAAIVSLDTDPALDMIAACEEMLYDVADLDDNEACEYRDALNAAIRALRRVQELDEAGR